VRLLRCCTCTYLAVLQGTGSTPAQRDCSRSLPLLQLLLLSVGRDGYLANSSAATRHSILSVNLAGTACFLAAQMLLLALAVSSCCSRCVIVGGFCICRT
jgi:hypothetical protein